MQDVGACVGIEMILHLIRYRQVTRVLASSFKPILIGVLFQVLITGFISSIKIHLYKKDVSGQPALQNGSLMQVRWCVLCMHIDIVTTILIGVFS